MTKEASEKIKVILEKILTGYVIGKKYNYCLEYSIEGFLRNTPVHMHSSELELILEHLQERKIIDHFVESGEDDVIAEPTYRIYFSSEFPKKAEDYLDILSGENGEDESKKDSSILYLDEDGNFWHGNKEKLCYAMGAKSDRLSILKYLTENDGFQNVDDMATALGGKNKQNLRTEIGKIRQKVTHFLKINGDDLIESKKDSGYRINPKYKIVLMK